jgi:hypothetical protein
MQQPNPIQETLPVLTWHHDQDDEPNPSQLCYLLTTTGLLTIGYYPPDNILGNPNSHYLAWAPLSDTPITFH